MSEVFRVSRVVDTCEFRRGEYRETVSGYRVIGCPDTEPADGPFRSATLHVVRPCGEPGRKNWWRVVADRTVNLGAAHKSRAETLRFLNDWAFPPRWEQYRLLLAARWACAAGEQGAKAPDEIVALGVLARMSGYDPTKGLKYHIKNGIISK